MADISNQAIAAPSPEQLNYLWDEYKYRHGLCWKAVYKIVAVVIVLAVIPYKPELKPLGYWLLAPAVIGTLFAAFGLFVVNNELRLFAKAKVAHDNLHNQFLSIVLTKSDDTKMAGRPGFLARAIPSLQDMTANIAAYMGPRWTLFDIYVHLLIIVLLLLSLGNAVFLAMWRLP